MESENQGSGAPNDPNGASGDNHENKGGQGGEQKKFVPFENHKRALDDLHKYKNSTKELQAKLDAQEAEALQKQNDFKSLYEREKKAREETEGKYSKLNSAYLNTQKYNAIQSAAQKAGLRDEALQDLELISLDSVKVEMTTSGRFIVDESDVSSLVDGLKKGKPHWFKDLSAPKFNGGGGAKPGNQNTELTPEYMVQLQRKDPQKYKELFPKFLEQRNKKTK